MRDSNVEKLVWADLDRLPKMQIIGRLVQNAMKMAQLLVCKYSANVE